MFALTKRLTLRPGWPEDAPALSLAIGHEAVVRNLSRAPWPYALGDAEAFLSLPRAAHQARFQIMTRGENRLIGGIELIALGDRTHELGYWLTPDRWGLGYATEAATAVTQMARHALGSERLVGRHMIDNPASGRVLRKLGFVETGRSRLFSLARGGEVECVDLALDLTRPCVTSDAACAMPIAA
ncbi:Protein N-acetyltransferase, RimJ/RimL family [Sphingomonas palmae]|uniref:Protein N-acetyltransferase, RimJ/RimL family n=1 Tax=Sphingomonas palmae TaxID=1855283 RepID=A0A1H7QCI3_9SPHN|nr:GNAT family N-acetyltransferase [Sphingomonas palmae]SEL45364.1 Protein N-acetyltransferase, RimJ/RimL family [Sphingomonas palmae]